MRGLFVFVLLLAACGTNTPETPLQWNCSEGWVAATEGGCGPALLLCAQPNRPASCATIDLQRPATVTLEDGGTSRGFSRGADGGVVGAWPDPTTFQPPAGVPTCAMGWTRTADGRCDPALSTTCSEGSAALPGGSCTRTSMNECGTNLYPDVPPERGSAPLFHVRAGAVEMGADGSEARPFPSVTSALRNTAGEAWIRIAAGRYTDRWMIDRSVHLLGACAARTVLEVDVAMPGIFVGGTNVQLDLRGVTVRGGGAGINIEGGTRAQLTNVHVVGAQRTGVRVVGQNTQLTATDLWIERTTPQQNNTLGLGLYVDERAGVVLRRSVLSENRHIGIEVIGGGTAQLSEVVVRSTRPSGAAEGIGVFARQAAHVTMVRSVVRENAVANLYAGDSRTVVELEDSVIAAGAPGGADGAGQGMYLDSRATLDARRTSFEDNIDAAIVAFDLGTQVRLREVALRGTRVDRTGTNGAGISLSDGAQATLERVLVESNHQVGVRVGGGRATMTECIVRGTEQDGRGNFGTGVRVDLEGTLVASRVLIERNREAGLLVDGTGSTAVMEDSVVRDTQQEANGTHGSAVASTEGGALTVRRSLLANSYEVAAWVGRSASDLQLEDVAILSTQVSRSGQYGRGISATESASLRATRVWIDDAHEVGVLAVDLGTNAQLQDVFVQHIAPSSVGYGVGFMGGNGARIEGTRVAIAQVNGLALGLLEEEREGVLQNHSVGIFRDVWVQDVASSPIQRITGTTPTPTGAPTAYGVHVTKRAELQIERACLVSSEHGFYNSEGTLTLRQSIVTAQRLAGGVHNGTRSNLRLENVLFRQNTNNAVLFDLELPSAGALAPPTPLCGADGC